MNKYNSRLNKLTAKTHDYFLLSDFELLRDYWKARMEETGATWEQYEEVCARIDELIKSSLFGQKNKSTQEAKELHESDANIHLVTMHRIAESHCAESPQGSWISKSYSKGVSKCLNDAKKYFKYKRKV